MWTYIAVPRGLWIVFLILSIERGLIQLAPALAAHDTVNIVWRSIQVVSGLVLAVYACFQKRAY